MYQVVCSKTGGSATSIHGLLVDQGKRSGDGSSADIVCPGAISEVRYGDKLQEIRAGAKAANSVSGISLVHGGGCYLPDLGKMYEDRELPSVVVQRGHVASKSLATSYRCTTFCGKASAMGDD